MADALPWVFSNQHGGLTLVALPGFESYADELKVLIEELGHKPTKFNTPVDVVKPKFGYRSNGEPWPKLGKEHIGGHDCVILTSGPGTPDMLIRLILFVGYLAGRKASRITVMTGYFPLGRSDKDEGSDEFALPHILYDALNGASQGLLSRIICVDPHCDQIVMAGPAGRITPVYLTKHILKAMLEEAQKVSKQVCLAFPDDTAAKRFEPAMEALANEGKEFPVVVSAKRRTSSKQCKVKYIIGDVDSLRGAIVIALDDETATGDSQIHAAERFKQEFGAKEVWAAVSHGVLCGKAPVVFSEPDCPVDRLYISDTIPVTNRPELAALVASGRLRVIPWIQEEAEILYYMHWDNDIRGMR